MNKVVNYIKDSVDELLNKVSWPTWKEVQSSAVLVMIASIIISLVVFVMDYSFKFVMEEIYKLFS
jgi:preprotein translocase subunit SecE